MYWSTQNESYGNFHPSWRRSFITKLPQVTRQQTLQEMKKRANTTSHEYGLWYHDDEQRRLATHERAHVTSVFDRSGSSFSVPTPKLPPISDDRNFVTTLNRPTSNTPQTYPKYEYNNQVNFSELRNIDVQLLMEDNSLISLAPISTRVEKYSFPRGKNEVRLPDIKEVNLKFQMRDKIVDLRVVPKRDD